jgi:hypothetical protein
MPNGSEVPQVVSSPTRCHLWRAAGLTSKDLHDCFEMVESFIAESHHDRSLSRCKDCGQLYFYEFYEYWGSDGDSQYSTYVPVSTREQALKLQETSVYSLLAFRPRLQKDFPQNADEPRVFWVRDEEGDMESQSDESRRRSQDESGNRIVTVKVSELHEMPGLTPPKDAVFTYLFSKAAEGHLPVYFGAIPLSLVRPFSTEYDPRRHPIGRQAVDAEKKDWLAGRLSNLWVYPDASTYVMSDDYITFYAAQEGQPDFVPCFILGETEDLRIKDLQGPIQVSDVRKALGLPD